MTTANSTTAKVTLSDTTSNPAPLGLLGFGMTTILLNLHNAGLFELNSMIMGMGLFMGGSAQVIAGVQEWKKNNTFGATAFTAYGFFWLSLVATWLLPSAGLNANASSAVAMGFYLGLWGLFTAGMFVGTLRINKALQVVFGSLTVLFFLLAAANFTGSHMIHTLAGIEGVLCGLSALYACIAQILNEVYGEEIMPIGKI
ncbi:acetate uptake transporter [Algivirga pacifica]|uniref:Acetate uptake transporter n=1 Tax=Algivirga pacifica TaxID=1162670 RepID=A0ABP9DIW5_9BACT